MLARAPDRRIHEEPAAKSAMGSSTVLGDVIGSVAVGNVGGDGVGSEVEGGTDGDMIGSDVVGGTGGDMVGSGVVGDTDDDTVERRHGWIRGGRRCLQ